MDAGVSQPPAEVIQGNTVQQKVSGVAVPERVSADAPPESSWPASTARRAACCTHRQAVVRETPIRGPLATAP